VGWSANVAALAIVMAGTAVLSLALLWRVTTWTTHSADLLTNFEGLRIGETAKPLSSHVRDQDFEVTFGGKVTFLVFATSDCRPCAELLRAASMHPATRAMRLVVVSEDEEVHLTPDLGCYWESYRFDNEEKSRRDWKVPVSPYFYVLDEFSRIAAKGVANRPAHLDRLLELPPSSLQIGTLESLSLDGAA
jgi:hypothetical protein